MRPSTNGQELADDQNTHPYAAGGAATGLSLRELLALIREDYDTHDRNWGLPGLHAVVVQRIGAWRLGLPRGVPRKSVSLAYRVLRTFIRNCYGIEISDQTRLGRRIRIGHQGGIVIDDQAAIGDGCLIRHNVTIGRATSDSGAPQIGRNVEMSPGAVLIGAINVGDDARIGPNAVVVTDVPAGSTAFATPARRMPGVAEGAGAENTVARE